MRNMEFFQGIYQFSVPNLPYQYCFPLFYYDGSALIIAFLTPLDKIKALLPSPHLHPVPVSPWHGITLIGAYEYRDTDIGPYNELGISFPVTLYKSAPLLKGLQQVMSGNPLVYIWQLPVTTEIARWGGVELGRFPKFLANIEFERADGWIHCRLAEGDSPILTLQARELPTEPAERMRASGLLNFGSYFLRFDSIVNVGQMGRSRNAADVRLELGSHHISEELRKLGLGRMIGYRYLPACQLILPAPNESYPIP